MKAVLIRRHGSLDEVELAQLPRPQPGQGQVLVRTEAAALNHLDLFVVGGLPGIRPEMPHVLGSDGSGIVDAVGPGVARFQPGDRVMLNACVWCGRCEYCTSGQQSLCIRLQLLGEHLPGTFAEFFVAPEASLEKVPPTLTPEEAAAGSLSYLTALRMLLTQARVQAGQDVLIHGIGGGVSQAALQICRLAGARTFVTSSSETKLRRAAELGADVTISYSDQDVAARVLDLTRKRGVDIVVDSVGAQTWLLSLRLARKGGTIVTCGATTGPNPQTEIRLIFWKHLQIVGSTMGTQNEFRSLVKLYADGKLTPIIDNVMPLSQAHEALNRMNAGKQFGKIVLVPDEHFQDRLKGEK